MFASLHKQNHNIVIMYYVCNHNIMYFNTYTNFSFQ